MIVSDGNGGQALTLVLSLVVVDVIAGGGLPIISDRQSVVRGSENTLTSSNFDFRSMHKGGCAGVHQHGRVWKGVWAVRMCTCGRTGVCACGVRMSVGMVSDGKKG